MTNGIDSGARAQFNDAARRLAAAEARIRALSANPLADETARQAALAAYREARLLWLSSEAVLRSAAITAAPRRHAGKSVVILGGNAHIDESIALLLRLRGFRTTVLAKHRIEEGVSHGRATAVIVDIERDPHTACVLAADSSKLYPGARIIGMVWPALESYRWRGFDAILVKPASIDVIAAAVTDGTGP